MLLTPLTLLMSLKLSVTQKSREVTKKASSEKVQLTICCEDHCKNNQDVDIPSLHDKMNGTFGFHGSRSAFNTPPIVESLL